MKRIGFVFLSGPHCSSAGREGLDALLAASAYCEDIHVFFIGEGVQQLISGQQPSELLSRDYISGFKLMDLYDIENVYLCQKGLEERGLLDVEKIIDAKVSSSHDIAALMASCHQLLSF
ncbi:sulfurtransferase complex subunit TusC [Vibrio sp. 10N.261.55.A7]|uniref:sulfurtransferase complex subunit TusC n=1 Tax=Vibrio sp. 10N.261.55.A7 TaxID=1880851 RepID=UPI000C8593A1|nr:sulfurtransferase complex subunit TusC [Vibrio sp. 10N.261.55.A7]PMJ91149.1 sulfurtransferase TusC [Vibrio sp. 10N.261.55.A7]